MLCPYKRKSNLKKIEKLVSESITNELCIRESWLNTLPGFSQVLNKAYQDIVKLAVLYIVPDAKNIEIEISFNNSTHGKVYFDCDIKDNIELDFEKPLHTRQLKLSINRDECFHNLQITKDNYQDYMEYYG